MSYTHTATTMLANNALSIVIVYSSDVWYNISWASSSFQKHTILTPILDVILWSPYKLYCAIKCPLKIN